MVNNENHIIFVDKFYSAQALSSEKVMNITKLKLNTIAGMCLLAMCTFFDTPHL